METRGAHEDEDVLAQHAIDRESKDAKALEGREHIVRDVHGGGKDREAEEQEGLRVVTRMKVVAKCGWVHQLLVHEERAAARAAHVRDEGTFWTELAQPLQAALPFMSSVQ